MTKIEKTRRIYLEREQRQLSLAQSQNLFWVRAGRAYCFADNLAGEQAARVYRMIQEMMPLEEVYGTRSVDHLMEAEECLQVDGEMIQSVRQVGVVKIGNVRLLAKQLNVIT